MESLFFLIVIGLILLLFVGSIMGISAHGRISRLESEIRYLRQGLRGDRFDTDMPGSRQAASPAPSPETVTADPKPPEPRPRETEPRENATPASAAALAAHKDKLQTLAREKLKPKPKRSLEELVGAQWSVWVGGLALLVGTLFMLRFAIESGFFSPFMRVIMASVMGVAFIGLGEFLRRKDDAEGMPAALREIGQRAYIPGVLTGAGVFALLGAAYAAYALYGFIGPAAAFVLMGMISLGGMFLGAVHGPKLSALGLAASLATPLFIHTSEPNYLALYIYLGIVSLAAIWLSLKRDWIWLKLLTMAGLLGWSFLSIGALDTNFGLGLWGAFVGAGFGLSFWLSQQSADAEWNLSNPFENYNTWLHLIWTAAAALILMLAVYNQNYTDIAILLGYGFAALFMAAGAVFTRQKWLIAVGGITWALITIGVIGTANPDMDQLSWVAPITIVFTLATLGLCARNILSAANAQTKYIWAILGTALPLASYALWPDII